MYPQVFEAARQVDQAFLIILGVCVGIMVLVTGLMLGFVWRYHHKRHPVAAQIHGNVWAELTWIVIPAAIVMGLFWFGWTSYTALRGVPEGALEIGVDSRMWSWSFTYPDGKRSNELVVPIDTAVKLNMTSRDVIHSFYVPAMRIKMDTVPGLTTYVWFKSDSEGEFDILCAEYCGLKHANMITLLKVVSKEAYEAWLAGGTPGAGEPGALDGRKLLETHGCLDCHSLDGSEGIGPTLKGIAGREVQVQTGEGAKTVASGEGYLRRAILAPSEEIVSGFDDIMPPYEGAIPDEELDAMIRFLLKGDTRAPHPGRALAEAEGCVSCHSTDGSEIAGPSFRALFGSRREGMVDGAAMARTADEPYLRESILNPGAFLTNGYDDMMPPYDYLEPADLDTLVDFIRSLAKQQNGQGAQ